MNINYDILGMLIRAALERKARNEKKNDSDTNTQEN